MGDTTMSTSQRGRKRARRSPADYSIACLCPMAVELTPLRAMLDAVHDSLSMPRDHNAYILGELGGHNVVICVLSSIGNNDSAVTVTQLKHDFPAVRFYLLVGIAGGVPSASHDIRLGDVVVSMPTGTAGGVIQFDRGKAHEDQKFEVLSHLNKPPATLISHVKALQSLHQQEGNKIAHLIEDMVQRHTNMKDAFCSPGLDRDILFQADYPHRGGSTCDECHRSRLVERPTRIGQDQQVHYGTIGSSNCVLRNAAERDRLGRELAILAVEMEAAGLMDSCPCLVVRGICDYADSHKHKGWQPFAAAAAAAYTKELLQIIPPLDMLHKAQSHRNGDNQDGYISSHPGDVTSVEADDPGPQSHGLSKKQIDVEIYQILVKSLEFERMDARIRNVSNAMMKTCGWLFDHPTFSDWLDQSKQQDHHGFLWIRGKPGSGKSTLMKAAFQWTERRRRATLISYFFNARASGNLEKSSIGLYRSLTYQLLRANPGLKPMFFDQFSPKQRDGTVEEWTITELQNFLRSAVGANLNRPLNIFVDALDEGDDTDVRRMVSFLEELAQEANTARSSLKICLSSRHYPNIRTRRSLSLVVEDQPGHVADIKLYIHNKLTYDQSPELDELREQIYQKSAGVFLWVVLIIPMLNEAGDIGQIAAPTQCLESLPAELDELYVRILTRTQHGRRECGALLLWILFSEEPLSPAEALRAVQLSAPEASSDAISAMPDEMLRRHLVNCSRGLVEVTSAQPPIVQFIHETTRDHLLRKGGLSMLLPDFVDNIEGMGHDFLKEACDRLLFNTPSRSDLFHLQERQRRKMAEIADVSKEECLLDYAVANLFRHADIAAASKVDQKQFLNGLMADGRTKLSTWIRLHNTFEPKKIRRYGHAPLLYILAARGHASLVEALIPLLQMINHIEEINTSSDQRYGNALQAACVGCHKEVVCVLVDAGANVNIKGGEHGHPLIAAFNKESIDIVRVLLHHGAVLSDYGYERALFASIHRKFLPGIQVLLDQGVDINYRNSQGQTPLYCAAETRNIEVCQLLLKKGASVNPTTDWDECALRPVFRGLPIALDILQLLLERSTDADLDFALLLASKIGSYEAVQLLLKLDAKGHAQGRPSDARLYNIVLHDASARGDNSMMRLLFRSGAYGACGACSQALQSHCYLYLLESVLQGDFIIVDGLISHGLDVNFRIRKNNSVLHSAIIKGHPDMVELLINRGADVNLRNASGESPLQKAQRKLRRAKEFDEDVARRERVAELLIMNGAVE